MEVIREDSDKTRLFFFHYLFIFYTGKKRGKGTFVFRVHIYTPNAYIRRHVKYLYITLDLLFSKISRTNINNIVLVSSTLSAVYVCVTLKVNFWIYDSFAQQINYEKYRWRNSAESSNVYCIGYKTYTFIDKHDIIIIVLQHFYIHSDAYNAIVISYTEQ